MICEGYISDFVEGFGWYIKGVGRGEVCVGGVNGWLGRKGGVGSVCVYICECLDGRVGGIGGVVGMGGVGEC